MEKLQENLPGFFPNRLIEAVADTGALGLPLDQSRTFQFLQVLGYGGLGKRQFPNKVATHADLSPCQVLQNCNPCRMP